MPVCFSGTASRSATEERQLSSSGHSGADLNVSGTDPFLSCWTIACACRRHAVARRACHRCLIGLRCVSAASASVKSCTRADLSRLLVRRGVFGDLEEMEVDHFFHLVVVSPALAHDHGGVEQEDVSAVQRESGQRRSVHTLMDSRLGPNWSSRCRCLEHQRCADNPSLGGGNYVFRGHVGF